jgi:hypothetical protein
MSGFKIKTIERIYLPDKCYCADVVGQKAAVSGANRYI